MKKINLKQIIAILLALILSGVANAQYVYTPKGTPVEYTMNGGTYSEIEARDFFARRGWTHLVTQLAPGTGAYNCHAYAWHMTEPGSIGQIDISAYLKSEFSANLMHDYYASLPAPNNIKKYWEDGSYTRAYQNDGTKVYYGSQWVWDSQEDKWYNWGDHSALLISPGVNGQPPIYESKWGTWGVYRHPGNIWLFTTYPSNHQYYKKAALATPVITGFNSICYGSPRSFSATNWSQGYYWDKSSNLSLSSTTNSSITVSAANSSSSGAGWVSIKNSSGTELTKYNLWVGGPTISVTGPTSATLGSGKSYQASSNNYSGPAITGYEWEISPTSGTVYNYGYTATVYFNAATSYMVRCRARNACGYGPWAHIYVNVTRSASPVYPNPVDDILYVEVGSNADPNARNAAPAYDIRLYNGQGIQVLQKSANGGTVQLDVSRLPDGIYYLHIYDGVSSTPEMHQIIVKH